MATENGTTSMNLLLSRDELLLTLQLLETAVIPGLDPDPLGELSAEAQGVALAVAGRGLRARELARLGDDGTMRLHGTLMQAVGAAAYAEKSVAVFHWEAGAEEPQRLFAHVRGDDAVLHLRPDTVLHLFALFGEKAGVAEQLLTFCQWESAGKTSAKMTLSEAAFANAREAAQNGDAVGAAAALQAAGVAAAAATDIANTMSNNPKVTVFQTIAAGEDGEAMQQDVTIVHDETQAWSVRQADGTMQVAASSKDGLVAQVNGWL